MTVAVPLVDAAKELLDTVSVYVAPFCPCMKLPEWVDATLRSGAAVPNSKVTLLS